MKGKDLKIIIEKLQENNISLETINKILMLDERLINKINLAKDKQDLNNIIKIILTKYPCVENVIEALNIYFKSTTVKIKNNVTKILIDPELVHDNYSIALAREYVNKPSEYVKKFITNYAFYREINDNIISLDILIDGINEIYNTQNDITEYIENALKIYVYELASAIEYPVFKEFLNNFKLTNNEIILSLINRFLTSSVKSLEELENLSQIMIMLISTSKVIDNDLGINIRHLYLEYSTLKYKLVDIDNKNEVLKIVLNENVDSKDIDLILHIARYFKYSNEIISLLRLLYEAEILEKDYEVLNEILNDENLYNDYYYNFSYFIGIEKSDLTNRLYNVLHFEYFISNSKDEEPIKRKKKNNKLTGKKNKILEQYIALCDEALNEDIEPSKLVRKK